MTSPDLNLLGALDVLLAEKSVTGAARRLGLSPSAMSRTLTRLREATGDPLLVPAGRAMVPTPHAAAIRDEVAAAVRAARAVLRPAPDVDIAGLRQQFTLRANDGFVDGFAAALVARVAASAPGVRLRFAPKPDKDIRPLRDGSVDLEIGVLGDRQAELRIQSLFRDDFVGVVREGHPLLAAEITPERFASFGHVVASRRGHSRGFVDEALAAVGLTRDISVILPSFPTVLSVCATSDLVGLVPRSYYDAGRATGRRSLQSFDLPFALPGITVSQIWHPRMDADNGHRWLRGLVAEVCRRPGRAAV